MSRGEPVAFEVVAPPGAELGESPVWCEREGRLWWVDVLPARLHSLTPATGVATATDVAGRRLGSLALRQAGGLLLATAAGIDLYDPEIGAQTRFAALDLPANQRLNDGRCDRDGRFWVGSMRDDAFEPEGTLFRIDPDGRATAMFDGVICPNSLATSPDGRTLYFADTRRFTIWSCDLDRASGAIANRRVFAVTTGRAGRPDGSCVDAEGHLWNAEYAGGQIVRYAPDGSIDRILALPVLYPTCCCFGGPDFSTLYVTSASFPLTPEQRAAEPLAGAVFAIRPGVHGAAEPRFAG